ncbi:hypothetical protein LCGC14_2330120, partial [marine sediment metagenome]
INARAAEKGQKSVNHGIQFLQQHEIIIDRKCQETINEFELYQWEKNKSGEVMGRPVDKDNHHIDYFVGDTLVMTKRGQIRIDSLLDNDEVLTRYGYKKILWNGKTKTTKTVKAVFSDGTVIEGIKTHQFITDQNIKKALNLLTQCDILLKNKGGILQWLVNQLGTMVINIGEVKELEGENIIQGWLKGKLFIFIGRFMKIIMGQFQKVMKFIILMALSNLLPLRISQLCYDMNINLNIGVNVLMPKEKTLIESGLLLRNGIKVQKAENGILDMGKKIIKIEPLLKKIALYVTNFFKTLLAERILLPVQTNANQNIEENRGLIMKSAFVHFVEKCLKLININLLKPVHVLAVTDTGQKKDVYNLQVDSDSHEYYANGILVANCIRYALEREMASLMVTPRISMVGEALRSSTTKEKPKGEYIEIWEGDKIIGYEKITPEKPKLGLGIR